MKLGRITKGCISSMLSILCVTRAEPYTRPFLQALDDLAVACGGDLILAADGDEALLQIINWSFPHAAITAVASKGYVESVLDSALMACDSEYVLRLDDDEMCSPDMVTWLATEQYREADHWKFPRLHLWPGAAQQYIADLPLWPDHQTRLSVRAKAGGRSTVHAGSPYGGGRLAPVAIEHHKFVVKTRPERQAIAARYDAVHHGYGTGGMLAFNLPEDALPSLTLMPVREAYREAWIAAETEKCA